MKKATINNGMRIILTLLLIISTISFTLALTPEGPDSIEIVNSTTREATQTDTINAIAGNVTQLNIVGVSTTQTWQGYYGNITGTIVLSDSLNNTFYDWTLPNPEGEIYASESEIDFSDGNIECYNFTRVEAGYPNLTYYESTLGLESDDYDGINETFNYSINYDFFYAGTNYINKICPTTQIYNASGERDPDSFQELLLYEKTTKKIIYTSIIEKEPVKGFNDQYWDFQMIVGENGHDADTTVTTYYFYVELE